MFTGARTLAGGPFGADTRATVSYIAMFHGASEDRPYPPARVNLLSVAMKLNMKRLMDSAAPRHTSAKVLLSQQEESRARVSCRKPERASAQQHQQYNAGAGAKRCVNGHGCTGVLQHTS